MMFATGGGRCCKVCCKMLKGSCSKTSSLAALPPAMQANEARRNQAIVLLIKPGSK